MKKLSVTEQSQILFFTSALVAAPMKHDVLASQVNTGENVFLKECVEALRSKFADVFTAQFTPEEEDDLLDGIAEVLKASEATSAKIVGGLLALSIASSSRRCMRRMQTKSKLVTNSVGEAE